MRFIFTTLFFCFTLQLSAQNFQVFNEPPSSNSVRSMAEWEETGTLVVTWRSFKSILAQIIAEASTECKVLVVCSNESTTVSQLVNTYGVTLNDNIEFLQTPNNSLWVRDYGPNTIYLDDDSLAIVDWVYNRTSRPQDNAVPVAVAEYMDIPVYRTEEEPYQMVHTGGNYHTDGAGLAFSSSLVIEENEPGNPYGTEPANEAQIDEFMSSFMGIDQYVKMEALPYDVINHIDMHFRPLDEETILVGQYPTGVSDGPQIEANVLYVLDQTTTQFGTPWNIVRIPMPPENGYYPYNGGDYRTYTNSVIVNNKILLPTYEYQYDTTAIQIYEEHMPGYEVVGINCNQIIPSLGALHCITKEVGAHNPLRIVHEKVKDQIDNSDPIPVSAQVTHNSGVSSVKIYYRYSNTAPFESFLLEDAGNNVWEGLIPNGLDTYTTVEYYIEAEANSGKMRTRPVPAPTGFYSFDLTFPTNTKETMDLNTQLLSAFPNPSSGITCIPIESKFGSNGSLKLYDLQGRLIETLFEGPIPQGEHRYYLHADQYPAGTYLIEWHSDYKVERQQLIIQR